LTGVCDGRGRGVEVCFMRIYSIPCIGLDGQPQILSLVFIVFFRFRSFSLHEADHTIILINVLPQTNYSFMYLYCIIVQFYVHAINYLSSFTIAYSIRCMYLYTK
jgi:hypothetical protein